MKQIPFTALLIILYAALIPIQPARAQTPPPTPLRWGADADGGFPYVFQGEGGKMIGFEADLAEALAKELGRPIQFVQYQFDSLIPGVVRGDIDLAMNGVEILPDRLRDVDFSNPYYLYQLQLVVRAGESRFKNLEECKALGLTIGTLGGSAAERYLAEQKIDTRKYEDQDGQYRDLSGGRGLAGVLLDLPAALYYASPDRYLKYGKSADFPGLKFLGAPFAEGYYGIAVKKGSPLKADLDGAIAHLRTSGELKRILQKWELWNADQYRLYGEESPVSEQGTGISFAEFFPQLLEGAVVTVELTLASMALAVLIGLLVALCRLYGPLPLRLLAIAYVEFFRGIPVLLLLFFLYFGLAVISPRLSLTAMQAAVLGFGLNYGAYEAEIYRGGIGSIAAGQWEAAASLGMWPALTFRRVIFPQAIRVILPPMTNDFVALFKDTSVVSIIAVVELSKKYQILSKTFGGYLEIGLTTAALYLVMSVPLGFLSRWLEQKWGRG